MSDFLEEEAEVSDAEENSDLGSDAEGSSSLRKEKSKSAKKKAVVDSSDEEDEEEDDEDVIREEMKDLINDDEEEESSHSDEEGSAKKRKHNEEEDDDDDDDRLEDEDYDLIEENLGVKVKRKKFRRLKISDDEDSDADAGAVGDDRDAIANELFEGSGDEEDPKEVARPEMEMEDVGDEEEEESDVDDFIVDDEGQPISAKGPKRSRVRHRDSALQEAQDIFGGDFDFSEFEQYGDDYEEEEEDMDYEEEEEGDEEIARPKKKVQKKRVKKSIFDVYEPSELERGHFTELDNDIRTTDIPERFQLRTIPVRPTEEGELEDEADWIFKHAFCTPTVSIQSKQEMAEGSDPDHTTKGPTAIGKIREALNFMRNQQFEVPFIAFYRKEYVEPDLNINDLWKVYHWDQKWSQLRRRKKNLVNLFEKLQKYQYEIITANPDEPLSESFRALTEQDIERISSVETIEELQDVYGHFLLYYGRDVAKMHNSKASNDEEENGGVKSEKVKQAFRKDGYTICVQAGLDSLARKFGLTPEQFGENLRDNYQRHEVEQYPTEPFEVSHEYICNTFPTSTHVIKGAQHMVAMQIARDPLVRQCVRSTYYERAKLNVKPTKKGKKEIDENHYLYSMKYLKNKPVKDLKGDDFLKLTLAEEEHLIKMSMGIDFDQLDGSMTYYEEIKQLYYRDEFSHNVQEWNKLRGETLEQALVVLYSFFEKELRRKLLQEAKDGIVKAASRKLYNWLKIAPYQAEQQLQDYDDDDYDPSHGLRVIAIAFTPDTDSAVFAAFVDGDGIMQDFLRSCHLLVRRNAFKEEQRNNKEGDLGTLKKFIVNKKPHVIVVGGANRDAQMIVKDVKTIVNELEAENEIVPIPVELVDCELSQVYSTTKQAEASFRDYPPLLREAISLARRIQDPLIEFSQLCTPEEEILFLRYHPLQDHINKEDLLNALQLEFINRTNEVGVDINRCLAHSHTTNLLQFVCGLGPRKAAGLIKTLKQNNGRLENRTQLVTVCHMGPKLFINTSGFIKIDTNSLGDSTEAYVEVLDGSRVHPETYEWARKMAVDALEYDDTVEDANPAAALEEILESPDRLKDLDLDAFAEELERQGYGNKAITLYDIRAELNHRYKDLRAPYRPPTAEEQFNMLTKETPKTFFIGKLVLCRVIGITRKRPQGDLLDNANPKKNEDGQWQCPFCLRSDFFDLSLVWTHFDSESCPGTATGVRTRLDNGVMGFIPIRSLSDNHVEKPEDRVQMGMTMHARITKIDIERFTVELTSRSSDLLDSTNQFKPSKDIFYDTDTEETDIAKEEEVRKRQQRQTYVKRVIVHPSFHNISYKEAEKLMGTMDQGDVIIRPSSKGSNHLTVTWKVDDGIYQHIDVREEGKENAFSLGQSLIINNEEFEDLDEIIARHIQPMAAFCRDIINYKYYVPAEGGKKEILDLLLKEKKSKAPSSIPYYLSLSKDYPGKCLLSYQPRLKAHHEYVSVTPEGYRYRGKLFHHLNSLIKWFKEHFRDPVVGTPAVGGRTPNLGGLDVSTIQRAVNSLPVQMYNTLAAVAGNTPMVGGYSVQQQPFATPVAAATPMMTPSYHAATRTPNVITPRYQPTPQTNWAVPATPRQRPGVASHAAPGQQRLKPSSGVNAAVDWGRAAAQWAKQKDPDVRTTPRASPRYSPRPSPRPSPKPSVRPSPRPSPGMRRDFFGRSPSGDATPLYDEN